MNPDQIHFNGELIYVRISPRDLIQFNDPQRVPHYGNIFLADPQLVITRLSAAYRIEPMTRHQITITQNEATIHRITITFAELNLDVTQSGSTELIAKGRCACVLFTNYCRVILENRRINMFGPLPFMLKFD